MYQTTHGQHLALGTNENAGQQTQLSSLNVTVKLMFKMKSESLSDI